MMNELKNKYILTIETSESVCSVSLGNHYELLGEYTLNIRNIHNERIAHFADLLLKEHNVDPKKISHIGVSAGPGSYTGLRIGFSMARGLSFATGAKLIPIPTPEIYAYKARLFNIPLVSVINAHRNELYVGYYQWNGYDLLTRENVTIYTITDFLHKFRRFKIALLGSAVKIILNLPKSKIPKKWIFASPEFQYISASDLYHYLLHIISNRHENQFLLEEPLYVRDFKGTY